MYLDYRHFNFKFFGDGRATYNALPVFANIENGQRW